MTRAALDRSDFLTGYPQIAGLIARKKAHENASQKGLLPLRIPRDEYFNFWRGVHGGNGHKAPLQPTYSLRAVTMCARFHAAVQSN